MSQDAQVWMTEEARDRLNKLKPDFTFTNKSGILHFLIDLFILVKPIISEGHSIQRHVLQEIVAKLFDKREYLKSKKAELE